MLLRNVKDQLAASREQILALKKKLDEVQKAKDHTEKAKEETKKVWEEAEQHEYDVGVAEAEDALRTEVPGVCRIYCAQVWDKASTRLGLRLLLC